MPHALSDNDVSGILFSPSNMPAALALAANELQGLAANASCREWEDCGEPDDLELQRQAITSCRKSLEIIERVWQISIAKNLADLKERVNEAEGFLIRPPEH